jgi:hypothetical protein
MALLRVLLLLFAFAGLGLSGAHLPVAAAPAPVAMDDHGDCHAPAPETPKVPACCPDGCDGGCLAPAAMPAVIDAAAMGIARSPQVAAREPPHAPAQPARLDDPPRPFDIA